MADIFAKENHAAQVRRTTILEVIAEFGAVRVGYLGRLLQVSTATIRSDLRRMERTQEVIRMRGAVLDPNLNGNSKTLIQNSPSSPPDCVAFARAAAALVGEGEAIILDGGQIGRQMIGHLSSVRGLTIITNDLGLALAASRYENLSVIVPGGVRASGTRRLVGSLAAKSIQRFAADKYFFSASFLDPERGVFGLRNESAQLSLDFITVARQLIVIAGRDAFLPGESDLLVPVEQISTIITDWRFQLYIHDELARRGITVINP